MWAVDNDCAPGLLFPHLSHVQFLITYAVNITRILKSFGFFLLFIRPLSGMVSWSWM